jgi:hypothetical protein
MAIPDIRGTEAVNNNNNNNNIAIIIIIIDIVQRIGNEDLCVGQLQGRYIYIYLFL